ncbi:MAG: 4-hydroxy-3-methylbut-2-enyl diphosphate reductase [Candidatus Tokpelaia sp.]|nr:MAG: 4-hydroxy-3-methylbut-2-enyl diphosphate reductase [Candidatus Tokpelaia sp.]KAA6206715.1 MAG: 4-hydroxy-3-methylbut-2-enyl diphosphate reductase [Candidatus Tokpelaia sp.]
MEKPSLTIRLCAPRGFCAGVERAIQIVVAALKKYGAPVYVRHEIVHNRTVVEGLRARGAVFIEEIDEIPKEHSDRPVVFSAHGVPKSVPAEAERRNLFYLDATCPLVSKVHKQAIRHFRRGRHIVLIGHAGHPEVIGTMGQLPEGAVSLVETVRDAEAYCPENAALLGFVSQTTLSVEDTQAVIAVLRRRFPLIEAPAADSICYATTNRQEAVKQAADGVDLFLIVGAPNSSNSRRLVEVAENSGAKRALLVQRAHELVWVDTAEAGEGIIEPQQRGNNVSAKNLRLIGLSAGASAPEAVVEEIIRAFSRYYSVVIDLAETRQETEIFPLNRVLRGVPLNVADMAFVNGDAAAAVSTAGRKSQMISNKVT